MAYNPYAHVNAIYNLKGQWDRANKEGNVKEMQKAESDAAEYYRRLTDNGYSDVADALHASNYEQAKSINDKWAKMNKTPTRDYFYSLGKSRGMSKADVDSLISWDDLTGEVSFGGKKIGRPDAVVDGVSYWEDTSKLDNAFNDYVNRSGTVRTASNAVNQENEKLFQKYMQEYDDLKNTNPFDTETAKAIMAKYDLAGLQGRDNAAASGSASNGGNIDSYAAANALRQQAALTNKGQMAVLDAYNQQLEHARALLSDIGVNIDRVFNEDETAKNNDVSRKSQIASVTGYTPNEWVNESNPYLNADGTIKDEFKDTDFSEIMAKAKESGNEAAYNNAAAARYYKIMNDYGTYGQYDDGNYIVPGQQKTEAARQFDDNLAAGMMMNTASNTAKSTSSKSSGGSSSKSGSKITFAQSKSLIEDGDYTQDVLDVYNDGLGRKGEDRYTLDNPPPIANKNVKSEKADLTAKEVQEWVDYLNNAISEKYPGYYAITETGKNQYHYTDAALDYIIINVLSSDDLTTGQQMYLLNKFGIGAEEIKRVKSDRHYK